MGLYTNVNSVILSTLNSKKISDNENALNRGFGFGIANPNKMGKFKADSLIKVCVIM